jgi:hypothetical protein
MFPSTLLRPVSVSRQARLILGPTASEAVLSAEAASLQAENTSLREENAALRREVANLRQQVGYWQIMRRRGHQPQAPGPKRRDYSHLPVVEEPPIVLPPESCVCPACGKPRVPMAETEDSEIIEIEVRPHRRRIRRRRYRATCNCPGQPQTLLAPAPPKLIPKAGYGISVWVYLLLEKFAARRALNNVKIWTGWANIYLRLSTNQQHPSV